MDYEEDPVKQSKQIIDFTPDPHDYKKCDHCDHLTYNNCPHCRGCGLPSNK
ncbi:MAG: hypothetical protein KAS32_12405 [Candidatus Peribacteraceae bacterium]|nr:hypothetical protein [Candidatus Peribacteraceae bacterium]